MGVKTKGFDDFHKRLKQMGNKAKELEKGTTVSFTDLFNDRFMQIHTKFNNIDEFFDKSPFEIQTEEDFDKINENELDEYVRNHSRFSGWEDMKGKAGQEWVAKQLGF